MAASPAPSILPSSSTDRLSTSLPRVCIVFPASTKDREYRYDLYIVDLNSDGSDGSQLTPTFRVFGEFFDSVAFFVLERTLYVVEGCCVCGEYCTHTKTIFKCNLPSGSGSGSGSGVKLERSMLSKAAYMYHIKSWPSAIPTPDGKKAVIFSRSVSNERAENPRHRCDFELFDPSGGRKNRKKCRKLPQLQVLSSPFYWIYAFSFIGRSFFLVQCKEQAYTIDLEPPAEERRWEPMAFPYPCRGMRHPYQLIGENMCFTPSCVYDIGVEDFKNNWGYCYPDLPPPLDSVRIVEGITPLDVVNDPRDCRFCILRMWSEEYRDMEGEDKPVYVPHAMLDVYSCDVVGCRMELGREVRGRGKDYELPCATRIKSVRLCLEPQLYRDYCISYFSSIPWTD